MKPYFLVFIVMHMALYSVWGDEPLQYEFQSANHYVYNCTVTETKEIRQDRKFASTDFLNRNVYLNHPKTEIRNFMISLDKVLVLDDGNVQFELESAEKDQDSASMEIAVSPSGMVVSVTADQPEMHTEWNELPFQSIFPALPNEGKVHWIVENNILLPEVNNVMLMTHEYTLEDREHGKCILHGNGIADKTFTTGENSFIQKINCVMISEERFELEQGTLIPNRIVKDVTFTVSALNWRGTL